MAPERLSAPVAASLSDPKTDVGISVVTIWETILAVQKRRIGMVVSGEETVRSWLSGNAVQVIPIETEIAILARTLPFQHEDPADRFIAATAYHLKCELITADDHLRRLPWLNVLPKRAIT
jgi:PIN domain nuclease of toxin-antitoxin system